MKDLTINSLFIFEYKNKLAKRVDFKRGINVVTSSKENGNDVGKSVLLKSIYHTLGADSFFDGMWKENDKSFLVKITVVNYEYYIYRKANMFKIFDGNLVNLYNTINRIELAEFLGELYGFVIKLPNRKEEELEITPPVFSYILNYVDQDHMNGTKFSSFKGLAQYPDFKENIIYNHLGIFNDEYFTVVKENERLKKEAKLLKDEKLVIENMLIRVKIYLEGMDAPTDLKALTIELNRKKSEYNNIVSKLKKVKNSLVKIRNEQLDIQISMEELLDKSSEDQKLFKKIHNNECPVCNQEISSTELKITTSSRLEDFYIMRDELESLMLEVNRKLSIKENEYRDLLNVLKHYENQLNINDSEVSDSIKHMGYIETQDNLILELGGIEDKINWNEFELNENNKKLKRYNDKKKKANLLYEQYMTESKQKYGLEEINEEKLKNIRLNYEARGSNKAISTIIWYLNLLKIKSELNENVLRFPLILDSPNNVESDDSKEEALFEFIFNNRPENSQLILSTLGFNQGNYTDFVVDNVIELSNEKYCLLNHKDYFDNEQIIREIHDL